MNALRRVGAWAARWQNVILYLAVTGVFVIGLWVTAGLRQEDARIEREAALRFCADSNERTALIRDFVLASNADADSRQYEFIADPVLRQGVIDQARRGRAEMRARVERTFRDRDCASEFPSPP